MASDFGDSSPGNADLEVVCALPPVLEPTRPGDTLVRAVGSALQQVGSHMRLASLLDPSLSPAPVRMLTPDFQSPRPLPSVQTSPGLLFQMAEEQAERVARRALFSRQNSADWGFGSARGAPAGNDEERWQLPGGSMRELGLPHILLRRGNSSGHFLSPGSSNSVARVLEQGTAAQVASARPPKHAATAGSSRGCLGDATAEVFRQSSKSSFAFLERPPEEGQGAGRTSILDFEHLFMQYYVELQPRRRFLRLGFWRRLLCPHRSAGKGSQALAVSVLPSAKEVAEAWKAETAEYTLKHGNTCRLHWQGLKLSRRALERQLDLEVKARDELSGPHCRVVLTLEPERVCHRLLWAIGDAIPPARALSEVQAALQARWPQCRVRCADDFFYPPSVFHAMLFFFTIALALSLQSLLMAFHSAASAQAMLARGGHGHRQVQLGRHRAAPLDPTREELLDQLAARVLLAGSLGHLWILHAMAATFPLRSLHSPLRRDLGCLAAYSPAASFLLRTAGPLAALALPLAMAVRFNRLGLALIMPTLGRPVGLHTGALLCSVSLPCLTGLVAWSVRSSLYSHHHLFIVLLFLAHLGTAFGFAAYFEMVRWAVYAAGAVVMGGLFLYFRYTTEFTTARLVQAAQLQWACAHVVPMLGLLLAAALEVESGVGRFLVDFICENQDIMPTKICVRLLRDPRW